MKKKDQLINVLIRYFILLIIGLSLTYLYKILLPITLYTSYFLLKLFYNTILSYSNIIITEAINIEIIRACVAPSAYYLLLILNLSTPMIKKKRIHSLLFSILSLFILNILRIFFIATLYIKNFSYADLIHSLFWYFFSIIFVVGIWFASVYLFKIKNIPVYTDMKTIKRSIKT